MHSQLTKSCITISSHQGFAPFPDALVRVHPGSVVSIHRLWHKCSSFTVRPGHVFNNVLIPHKAISTIYKGGKSHINFTLAACCNFMMMTFNSNTSLGLRHYLYSRSLLLNQWNKTIRSLLNRTEHYQRRKTQPQDQSKLYLQFLWI